MFTWNLNGLHLVHVAIVFEWKIVLSAVGITYKCIWFTHSCGGVEKCLWSIEAFNQNVWLYLTLRMVENYAVAYKIIACTVNVDTCQNGEIQFLKDSFCVNYNNPFNIMSVSLDLLQKRETKDELNIFSTSNVSL